MPEVDQAEPTPFAQALPSRQTHVMTRTGKLAVIAASILMAAMHSAAAFRPGPYFPDRLSGSVSPKPGIPALSFDMALNENGRFEQIAITFEGRSFDLLDVPGAERLRALESVELSSVFFGFEPPLDWPGSEREGPWLAFFYQPRLHQPQFCEAGKALHVLIYVGVSGPAGPVYFDCYD